MSAPKLTVVDGGGDRSALEWVRGYLAARGSGTSGGKFQCPGPRHGDGDASPSLAVRWWAEQGRVTFKCWSAKCDTDAVLAALGLTRSDLHHPPACSPAEHAARQGGPLTFPPMIHKSGRGGGKGAEFVHEAFHEYGDGRWRKERLRHPVTGKKDIDWQSRDARGAYISGLRDETGAKVAESSLPIYREPLVREARRAGEVIVLCESESSVDALMAEGGIVATTWAGGAHSVHVDALTAVLGGYDRVVVIPDYDDGGFACLDTLTAAGLAPHVLWPDEPDEDAKDMLRGWGALGLRDALDEAVTLPPGPRPPLAGGGQQEAAGGADADPAADGSAPDCPALDDERALVIAPWAAVMVDKHVTSARQGRTTRGEAEAREKGDQAPGLRYRAWALGGIAHYPAAELDRDEVTKRLVDAVIAHGGEDAALGADELRTIAHAGWAAGRREPMLPLDPERDDVPLRRNGKPRACLPSADEMAKVTKAAQNGEGDSPVTMLIEFADQQWEFGNDGAGWLFCVPKSGPRIAGPVGEQSPFRRRLTGRAYDELGRTFRGETYSQVLDILRYRAELAPATPVHLRVARWRDGIVLDLGTPLTLDTKAARLVEVTPTGWRVVDSAPGHPIFQVPTETRPLPEPVRGGSLDLLARLLGLAPTSREFRVVVGWLLTTLLSPDEDVPVLWWIGPQGAGKSTRSALVTSILDPRKNRSGKAGKGGQLGRSTEDILVAAAARYIVTYDNLTSLSQRQSDVLCGLVTGTADEGRARFTVADAHVTAVQRAMSINGRKLPPGLQDDLLDRLAILDQTRLTGGKRRASAALWAEFDAHHPTILGALLDLAVKVLAHRPAVEAERPTLPRMATHGLVLRALDRATGGGYYDAYIATVRAAKRGRANRDPLISACSDLLERSGGTWTGTAADLFDALPRPADETVPWPGNGRVLSQRLGESPDVLAAAGISVQTKRSGKGRRLELTVTDPDDTADETDDADETDTADDRGAEGVADPNDDETGLPDDGVTVPGRSGGAG